MLTPSYALDPQWQLEKEMEALRESRASREAAQAVATGSKVVLTPKQQSAFGACRHGRKGELTDLLTSGGTLCVVLSRALMLNLREASVAGAALVLMFGDFLRATP